MLGAQELFGACVIEEGDEVVKVARDVDEAAGFFVKAKLSPG